MSRTNMWTQEMYERLRELYPFYTNNELEKLTGWKVKELQYRAGRLGLKKDKEVHKTALKKIEYTVDDETFIRANFYKYTNRELAQLMGYSLHFIRVKCHGMGLLRMQMEYWTDEQTLFLIDNYKSIGDKELAEIFNQKWQKDKGWSFKHIEKKRKYLKLKRSKEELGAIHDRNVELGRFKNCPVGRWLKYGVSKDGEIRMWRTSTGRFVPFIKVNGKFRHWARYTWEQTYGPVPPGYNVVFKDSPSLTVIENLECISNEELSRRNGIKANKNLSDNYIAGILSFNSPELRESIIARPDLIELKRQQILLKRSIKQAANGK